MKSEYQPVCGLTYLRLWMNACGITGGVNLPVNPPILPMLAKRVDDLPVDGSWIFEPKWDGFRALIFRDGDEILIQSRDEKPLNRYFPEVDRAAAGAVACRAACWMAKSSSPGMAASISRRCSSACIQRRRA